MRHRQSSRRRAMSSSAVKSPLHLAIKSVLCGAIILPVAPFANAELVIDQQIVGLAEQTADVINADAQSVNVQSANTGATDTAANTDANVFDGVDFDAIAAQTQDTQAAEQVEQVEQATDATDTTANTADQAVLKADAQGDVNTAQANTEPSVADQLIARLGFEGNGVKSQSLAKLAESYQTLPSHDARCQGVWLHPQSQSATVSAQTDSSGTALPAGAIYSQSDYGYYDAKRYAELSGNVIVEQNGQRVMADKIKLDTVTGEAVASGQVQFSDAGTANNGAGIIGVADNLQYDTDGTTARATDVAFASTSIGAHGYAGQMDKLSSSEYQMSDVMFTTCPPTNRKWHLDAERIDINSDTGRAVARNTTLRVKEVPVLYLPYFNFPIDDRRATGFLLPSVGFGASGSFEVSAPYYLNLAPNYDATITPTIFTNRNPMITGEFRYLTNHLGAGTLTTSYLPSDKEFNNEDRYRIRYDHLWRSKSIKNLSAYALYQRLSDAKYLSDFDSLNLENNELNLPRRAGVQYFNENIFADLRVEDFQRLDGTDLGGVRIADKDRPYARLPQLSINYRVPETWTHFDENLDITGVHNTAYFKKSIKDGSEAEKSGVRMYNQISASYPMIKSWGYVTPKLSLTHLYASYDEDSLAAQNLSVKDGSYSVFAPTASVDAGLFFQKQGSPFGLYDKSLGGYQTLTPHIKYTYTPYRDQDGIPNFDTSIAQTSYDQLLSDSWYLGYDRIQDLHAVTPAINYRYIDSSGRTRFEGNLAEQILLDDLRVGIDSSEVYTGKSSGLAWQASMQPMDNLWIDTAGAFTPSYDLNSAAVQLRYQQDDRYLFNFGVIERKEHRATNQRPLSAYTASAVFPINNSWRLLGQAQYDYRNDLLLDALVGVNYEDCCYGLSVYARRYRDEINPQDKPNTAIMAEFRLNGITSGGKLNRLLSDRVLGYDQAQRAWERNY